MELHDVEVVRELLLQREVLGDVGEGAGGAERGAVLEAEVLLEVERRDLAEARHQRLSLTDAAGIGGVSGGGGGIDLFVGGVVPDVREAVEGVGDGGKVGEEVRSGDIGGGLGGGDGGEFRDGDGGGGGGPPAGPGGSVGGVRIVQNRREALDCIRIRFGER